MTDETGHRMTFDLQGGAPLDLDDLAAQLQQGKPVVLGKEQIGHTLGATVKPGSVLEVEIQLEHPPTQPILDLSLSAQALPPHQAGPRLRVQTVQALTQKRP